MKEGSVDFMLDEESVLAIQGACASAAALFNAIAAANASDPSAKLDTAYAAWLARAFARAAVDGQKAATFMHVLFHAYPGLRLALRQGFIAIDRGHVPGSTPNEGGPSGEGLN